MTYDLRPTSPPAHSGLISGVQRGASPTLCYGGLAQQCNMTSSTSKSFTLKVDPPLLLCERKQKDPR
eukprot:scaffold247206_cov33-Tisochrysis_lutea.AAC.1